MHIVFCIFRYVHTFIHKSSFLTWLNDQIIFTTNRNAPQISLTISARHEGYLSVQMLITVNKGGGLEIGAVHFCRPGVEIYEL